MKAADLDAILLGEIGGLRPLDFDLGNSPREISPQVVGGRRAICHTSNGTAAIRAVATAPVVLLGCLRNSAAVARAALVQARDGDLSILLVCSGGAGGRAFARQDCTNEDPSGASIRPRGARATRRPRTGRCPPLSPAPRLRCAARAGRWPATP